MSEKTADVVEAMELPFAEEIVALDDTPPDSFVLAVEPEPEVEGDYSKTQDLKHFMKWLSKEKGALPPHSGKTTAGCERFVAKINMLDKEISKAVSRDFDCLLDDKEVEEFRKELRKMKRLVMKRQKEIEDQYNADDLKYAAIENTEIVKNADDKKWVCKKCDPNKEFSDEEHLARHMAMEHGMAADDKVASTCMCQIETKTAAPKDNKCPKCAVNLWKSAEDKLECLLCNAVFETELKKEAGTARISLVMTAFEKAITGAIINGMVSNGRNAEEIYAELKRQYKIDDREELAITGILQDLGYPMKLDRGNVGSVGKPNTELATGYIA